MNDYQAVISCKFGSLAVVATDANHVYATSNPHGSQNMLPFSIRGVDYIVSAHLYRHSDGSWHIGEEKTLPYQRSYHSLYMTRQGDKKNPSDAARNAAAAEIKTVVSHWILANPLKIQDARRAALQVKLDRTITERNEVIGRLKDLDAKIAKLREDLGQ